MDSVALQIENAEKAIEILQLKNLLSEEQNEKKQLMQQYEELVSSRNEAPTSVSFFSPPPDLMLLQQIESLKSLLATIKKSVEDSTKSNDNPIIKQQAMEIQQLKKSQAEKDKKISQYEQEIKTLSEAPTCQSESKEELDWKLKAGVDSLEELSSLFNPATTKVLHLGITPPLSPQAAQFYSATKSSDKAIAELQQQLNDSRKEAKRTAEVATRKCKEFRSLCCKLFGWRVDIIDSEKRNVKKCRLHSVFNEEDYLNIELGRRKTDLTPSKFLETLDEEAVGSLISSGGIPRLLLQLYQILHSKYE